MKNSKLNNHLINLDKDKKKALVLIAQELERAEQKHMDYPLDVIHSAAIVAEESGELVQAALQFQYEDGKFKHMTDEAIQTGAMAVRFLINHPKETDMYKSQRKWR